MMRGSISNSCHNEPTESFLLWFEGHPRTATFAFTPEEPIGKPTLPPSDSCQACGFVRRMECVLASHPCDENGLMPSRRMTQIALDPQRLLQQFPRISGYRVSLDPTPERSLGHGLG